MLNRSNAQPQLPALLAEGGCACPPWHACSAAERRSRSQGYRSYAAYGERANIARAQAEQHKLRAATLERNEGTVEPSHVDVADLRCRTS